MGRRKELNLVGGQQMRSINFRGDYRVLKYGFDSVNKWHLAHPSYNRAAAIYNWYWCEYCLNDDDSGVIYTTISEHRKRLAARKEKELGAGVAFDDYRIFFYRFWEELLDTAEEDVEEKYREEDEEEDIDWLE